MLSEAKLISVSPAVWECLYLSSRQLAWIIKSDLGGEIFHLGDINLYKV